MLKRFLILVMMFFISMHCAYSDDLFKITSVNLDTSNSIVLFTSSLSTVPEDIKSIKINSLDTPKRYYFDLNSSVLTTGAQNWFFNSKDIKQIKISQFNPNTVRVVLYTSEDFNKSGISIMKRDKSLILQFKDEICETDYFEPVYTDEKISSGKFYENLSISNTEINKIKEAQNVINKDKMTEVYEAFSMDKQETVPSVIKDLKLQNNFYLSSVSVRSDAILLSGFGNIILEKPLYLTNPVRIVYDIPNSITNYALRNKNFTSNGTVIKVAQFDSSRSRLVITPPMEDVDYTPVFSSDGQSVLFIKNGYSGKLYNKTNNATRYYVNKKNEMIITFDAPVIHSVKREGETLKVTLYNTYSYNEQQFKKIISKTIFQDTKASLMPKIGLSIDIPLPKGAVVKTYMGADGKAIKVMLNNVSLNVPSKTQPTVKPKKEQKEKIQKIKGKRTVVIDAGHGGQDYGAIREGINEKDINLDVARMISDILAKAGVTIVMTRDSDEFIALADRVDIASRNEADLFVSVHVNASVKPEINGLETHYYNDNSLDFANVVHANMINQVNKKDRGIFKSKFYVINHNHMPAILVEIGFISNDVERGELVTQDRKQKTAKAIADGILQYLKSY